MSSSEIINKLQLDLNNKQIDFKNVKKLIIIV